MSKSRFSIDLNTMNFPFQFSLKKFGQILPAPEAENVIPNLVYAENVIPTAEGFTSVGFESYQKVLTGETEYKNVDVYPVYNEATETGYVVYDRTNTRVFVYAPQYGNRELNISSSEHQIFVFFFRKQSYLFHKDVGLFKFDVNFQFVSVPITGLFAGQIKGIIASLNYLIAWDTNRIYWSDPINFTNFDPTGTTSLAGSTSVLSIKGEIQMVLPFPKGFVIYTNGNATIARFTQNVRNPWLFEEIKNSSGVTSTNQVTSDENLGMHFVWSSSGLGLVTGENFDYPFTEVTELLAGTRIEEVQFVQGNSPHDINVAVQTNIKYSVKISFVANRYLAISYGLYEHSYNWALLYDIHLKKWGKINHDHCDIFNFVPPQKEGGVSASETLTPRYEALQMMNASAKDFLPKDYDYAFWGKDFALLQTDGTVVRVTSRNLDDDNLQWNSTVLISNIALTKDRYSELSEIRVNGQTSDAEIFVRSEDTTLDSFYEVYSDPKYQWYLCRSVGRSHDLLLRGRFNISSLSVGLIRQGVL